MWPNMESWLRTIQPRLNSPPNEKGQGLVEYAMILILAVIMVIVLLVLFAPWLSNAYLNVVSNL